MRLMPRGGRKRPAGLQAPSPVGADPRGTRLLVRLARGSYVIARRVVIGLVGASIVIVGVVMLVVPGPAIVVIPLGLAVLALEFVWARRLLRLFRVRVRQMYRDQRRGNYRFWRHWLPRRR